MHEYASDPRKLGLCNQIHHVDLKGRQLAWVTRSHDSIRASTSGISPCLIASTIAPLKRIIEGFLVFVSRLITSHTPGCLRRHLESCYKFPPCRMESYGYIRRHGTIFNRATDYLPLIFPPFGMNLPRSSIELPGSAAFLDL